MKITAERLVRLRWLLLGAVSAGACGGNVDSSHDDTGSSGSAGAGVSGSGTTTGTGGKVANGGSTGVAGTGGKVASGGSSSVAGTGGATAGGGVTTLPHGECDDPQPAKAGFVTCGDGLVHREAKAECENNLPATVTCGFEPATYVCDGTKLEYCDPFMGAGTPPTSCVVGCTTDDDCEAGKICACGEQSGVCTAALCTVDADCDAGYFCRRITTEYGHGCGPVSFFQCQLADDTCASTAECGAPGDKRCQPVERGQPVSCQPIEGFACGRPFLVNGVPRVACLAPNTDWAASFELDASLLDDATRAQLAEGWNQLGALEHASVAAFARFTLQLLALGAPHALIVESNRALCDETRHAELCFGLAASFGSAAAGPGKLDSDGALARSALADVVLDTFLEGCIGETVAALEAGEALAQAVFPDVRQVLELIAKDEARHAALAWRFVAWGVAQAPGLIDGLRQRLRLELERAARARTALGLQTASQHEGLAAGGLLSALARAELRLQALRDVVVPCLAALERQPHASPLL